MPKGIYEDPIGRAEKIRQSKLGKKRQPFDEKWKKKISESCKLSKCWKFERTPEIREKIRKSLLGRKLNSEHKSKVVAQLNKIRKSGFEHHNWKGDEVSYESLHQWVYRQLGSPMKCEFCYKVFKSNRKIHWANKSGEYKRELTDWIRLCSLCHKKYDSR